MSGVPVTPGVVARGQAGDADPLVRLCPHGPALVRGAAHLDLGEGVVQPVDRPVVAVCRCGKTSSAPWCDSTHRAVPGYGRRP